MNANLSELNLLDDLAAVKRLAEASRWNIEHPGGLEVLVTLASASEPEELFQARLLWGQYPEQAPSLKFRDPSTGRLDQPSAWPRVRGFRPPSLDACVNWTNEGLAIHPEWRADPRYRWSPQGNVLLKVLRRLQDELDHYYEGRFK